MAKESQENVFLHHMKEDDGGGIYYINFSSFSSPPPMRGYDHRDDRDRRDRVHFPCFFFLKIELCSLLIPLMMIIIQEENEFLLQDMIILHLEFHQNFLWVDLHLLGT